MRIGDRRVGDGAPTYIIAEAGSNHDGELANAKELVDVAADAGADAVKFQTFRAESMYVENSGTVETPEGERSLFDVVAEAEMPYEWIPELHEYCHDRGIQFLSSPFDDRSIAELDEYVPAYKIGSSILSYHGFLERLAETGKPLIASTGAHTLEEVRAAMDALHRAGSADVALLHCVSSYPTPLEAINVRAVSTLAGEFDVPVGLSDHTLDPTTAPCAAVALGADILEKHITTDRSREGLDHSFAIEPDELRELVDAVRDTETALGDGRIRVQEVEQDWYENARRTVQATRDISEGAVITEADVDVLRSGSRTRGLDPDAYDRVVGSTAARRIEAGDGITEEDLGEP